MTELQRICILVAEDDVLIRNLLNATLGGQGHLVLGAADLTEAMELSEQYRGEIPLLIARDYNLAIEVTAARGETCVLLLSQSMETELREIARAAGPGAFRHRAELPGALTACIRKALTEPEAGGVFVEV